MARPIMKRVLKIGGGVVGVVVALAAGALLFIAIRGIPRYEPHVPVLSVEPTPERIVRGKKLSKLMCAGCHEDASTGLLTGKRLADMPSAFGEVYSSNITRHPDKGIGRWSDGELAYLLRTGIKPDGRYLPPWMIKMPLLSDEDLASIIAYLRSDDPAVAAADKGPAGITKPSLLSKVLTNTIMKPLPYPTQPIAAPARTDRVAWGRYLTQALDCYGCHSGDFTKLDHLEPEKSFRYLGGGTALVGVEGKDILSANLTPDEDTGIGRWSEADFVRALREGFRPDGKVIRYPMLPKAELDVEEAAAIYAYLRTVPKIRNEVKRHDDKASPNESEGKKLYVEYGCNGCHGSDGAGADEVPGLRRVGERFKEDAELRAWLDNPAASKPDTKMPAWKGIIAERDYPPLISYLRSLGRGDSAKDVTAKLGQQGGR